MEKEKKKKSKSFKSASSKKKLGAAPGFNAPAYGAEIDVLSEFMNKSFYKTLKTCLDLLSGDGSLEVSDTLVLTANYLKGDIGAKVEVQQRLTAREERDAPVPEGSGHISKPIKKKPDPVARMEFDQWVLPAYESALLKMMQGRLVGGEELGGPAERLARMLIDEAKVFQSAQPRGAIVPSIPEVDNTSMYEFAHTVSDAPMVVSDKVNSGSLLMLLEQEVHDADLPGSVAKLDEMLSQELANQWQACDEAAQLLIRAIKRHRGLKASIDASDREAVASSLDAARAVMTTAAQDIIAGCLDGALSKIEVLVASQELNNALNESAEAKGATGAAASGPSPEEVAKSQITALISKVKNESEAAVVAMEGAVEAQLYDRGADLIARIFLEERAVVQVLPVRPWQVKVKRTHAAVMGAIENVVTKLTAPMAGAEGPPPKTEKGKAAAERPMPFFEVMTLLISSISRCLGDAERALGIGMDPDPSWDMEFLNWAPREEETVSAEFGAYVNAMKHTRNEAEYALKMAVRNVVEAAGWTAGIAVATPEKTAIPGKLLMRQLEMSGALQRLQSRLMCCLKALQPPTTVLWNPDTLKVIQDSPTGETPPASPGSSEAVQEAAAMVPVLRAFKGLHEEFTDLGPGGEKKISQWLAQALINIAELERHCTHITMEVKGFAERVQPGRCGILDTEGEGEKDKEAAEQPAPETADATSAEETKQTAGEAQETKEDEKAAAELEAAALKELEADLKGDPSQSQPTEAEGVPAAEGAPGASESNAQDKEADEGDHTLQEVADILKMVASFMQSLRQSVSQNLQ